MYFTTMPKTGPPKLLATRLCLQMGRVDISSRKSRAGYVRLTPSSRLPSTSPLRMCEEPWSPQVILKFRKSFDSRFVLLYHLPFPDQRWCAWILEDSTSTTSPRSGRRPLARYFLGSWKSYPTRQGNRTTRIDQRSNRLCLKPGGLMNYLKASCRSSSQSNPLVSKGIPSTRPFHPRRPCSPGA